MRNKGKDNIGSSNLRMSIAEAVSLGSGAISLSRAVEERQSNYHDPTRTDNPVEDEKIGEYSACADEYDTKKSGMKVLKYRK